MNIWTVTGNLGKDAEVKVTQGGMTVCSFSIAVKSGYGDKAKTTWVNCGLFGKRAEGELPSYLIKGAQVCISGEAFLDEWQKDGVTQKMLKLNVDKLDLIGGKPQPSHQAPQQGGYQAPAPQMAAPQRPAPQMAPQPMAPQQQAAQPTAQQIAVMQAQQAQAIPQAPQPQTDYQNQGQQLDDKGIPF